MRKRTNYNAAQYTGMSKKNVPRSNGEHHYVNGKK